jgi:hypothetical protein
VRTIGFARDVSNDRDTASVRSRSPVRVTADNSAAGAAVASAIAGASVEAAAGADQPPCRANRPDTRRRAKWKRAALRKASGASHNEGAPSTGPGNVPAASDLPGTSAAAPVESIAAAVTEDGLADSVDAQDVHSVPEAVTADPDAGELVVLADAAVNEPEPSVRLVHDDDFSVCVCPGLYCPRGTHPYCSQCHKTSYESPCVHLQEYADELDFDC